MHFYEIYDVISSCDEDWLYLGSIAAASMDVALEKAAVIWQNFTQLIAIEEVVSSA